MNESAAGYAGISMLLHKYQMKFTADLCAQVEHHSSMVSSPTS
jgi:hypothetical protein